MRNFIIPFIYSIFLFCLFISSMILINYYPLIPKHYTYIFLFVELPLLFTSLSCCCYGIDNIIYRNNDLNNVLLNENIELDSV